jgi:DNA-binding MarR family transcriptional regulator
VADATARTAGMLIRRVQRRNLMAVDAALAEYDTNLAQWAVLQVIGDEPGLTGHALATRTLQSDQSLGTLITPLVERGLVARTRTGNKLAHTITPTGRTLLAAGGTTVGATFELRMSALDPEQLAQLCALLERIA